MPKLEGPVIVDRLFRTSNKLTIDEPGLCPRVFRQPDVAPRDFVFDAINALEQTVDALVATTQTVTEQTVVSQIAPLKLLDAAGGNIIFEVDVNGNVKSKGRLLKIT